MSTVTTDDGTSQARRDGPYSDLPNNLVSAAATVTGNRPLSLNPPR